MREEILRVIEKNSRIETKELAVRLGLTEAEVVEEMQAMENEGIIEKVTALIEVKVTPQRGEGFDHMAERIYNYPEVQSVYLISGGFDILITIEGKTLREVSQFVSDKLSTFESIVSTATHFILKKYKDHGTIMTKKHEDERQIITP